MKATRRKRHAGIGRKGIFVVVEMALALVLLAGAG